ncbi:hypothetical protein RUND412_004157 [Rhizina undulata]
MSRQHDRPFSPEVVVLSSVRRRRISEPPMIRNGRNQGRSLMPAIAMTASTPAVERMSQIASPTQSSFRDRGNQAGDEQSRFTTLLPPKFAGYGKVGSECSECTSCVGSESEEEDTTIERVQSRLDATQSEINLLQRRVTSFGLSTKPTSSAGYSYPYSEASTHRHEEIAYLRERVQTLEEEKECLVEELQLMTRENDLNLSLLRKIAENHHSNYQPSPASPSSDNPKNPEKDVSESPRNIERGMESLSDQLSTLKALENKHTEEIIKFQKQVLELSKELVAANKAVKRAQEKEKRLRAEKLEGIERERIHRLVSEELRGKVADLETVLERWQRAMGERGEIFMAMAAAEASRRHLLTQQFIHDYTLTVPHDSSSGQHILPLKASFLASVQKRRCLEGILIFSLSIFAVMLILRTHWVSHGIVDLWSEWVLWVLVIISGSLGAFRVWLGVRHDGDLDALFSLFWTSFVCYGILLRFVGGVGKAAVIVKA